jgi:hypothetical protein
MSTLADEMAALRADLASVGTVSDSLIRHLISQRLDRIAAQMPQRASDSSGRGVWQHTCGNVKALDDDPIDGVHERGCSWCHKSGAWQPLYTLGGPTGGR